MSFKIVRNDITQMNTEAIVNTANPENLVGPGCDTAIYKAAGHEKLLQHRIDNIGPRQEGEAFITPGFNLKAEYIIHAISPKYKGGSLEEEEKLRSCYRNSLRIALEMGIRSISFPLISTGSLGYPKEEGLRIAVDEINDFLENNEMKIYLVVFDPKATRIGEALYPDLEEYIDTNYVASKGEEEYGDWFTSSDRYFDMDKDASFISDRDGSEIDKELNPLEMQFSIKKEKSPSVKNAKPTIRKKTTAAPIVSDEETVPVEKSASLISRSIEQFYEIHESKLNERMKHMSDTFSEYLMYLIKSKKLENADVWKAAIVDKKVFSKIKNDIYYHPKKITALCLCIGARLNLDETKDLLSRAGYALSPCDKTDIIFAYFIENEIYDMIELDIQLEEHGLPCIIS